MSESFALSRLTLLPDPVRPVGDSPTIVRRYRLARVQTDDRRPNERGSAAQRPHA